MTPRELHKACIAALSVCPQMSQVATWDFDLKPPGNNKYNTLEDVVRYWLEDYTLWHQGYSKYLNNEVLMFFNDIFKRRNEAISVVCKQWELK